MKKRVLSKGFDFIERYQTCLKSITSLHESPRMGPIGPGTLRPTNEWAQLARALVPDESPRAVDWEFVYIYIYIDMGKK